MTCQTHFIPSYMPRSFRSLLLGLDSFRSRLPELHNFRSCHKRSASSPQQALPLEPPLAFPPEKALHWHLAYSSRNSRMERKTHNLPLEQVPVVAEVVRSHMCRRKHMENMSLEGLLREPPRCLILEHKKSW